MESASHLVIFTPLALNVANDFPSSQNDVCELFAQNLASRTQKKLQLSSIATKAVGGKDLMDTFENFQRALEVADFAIIVVPGSKINLLDAIYPRLLVFMTLKTEWFNKILLVCLGGIAEGKGNFDTTIFKHDPVIFFASSGSWATESDKWEDIFQFIRPSAPLSEETKGQASDQASNSTSSALNLSSGDGKQNHIDQTANSLPLDSHSSDENAEDESFDLALTSKSNEAKEEPFDEAESSISQDATMSSPGNSTEKEISKNDPLSTPASGQGESSNEWRKDPAWCYIEPTEMKESTGGWGKLKYLSIGILIIGIGTGVFLKAKPRIFI